MKKIAEFHDQTNGNVAKVFCDSEWDEFRVKFYDSTGKHMDGADYHTSDRQDAMNTAGEEHPDCVRTV